MSEHYQYSKCSYGPSFFETGIGNLCWVARGLERVAISSRVEISTGLCLAGESCNGVT